MYSAQLNDGSILIKKDGETDTQFKARVAAENAALHEN